MDEEKPHDGRYMSFARSVDALTNKRRMRDYVKGV
jgi:hypothetical protein